MSTISKRGCILRKFPMLSQIYVKLISVCLLFYCKALCVFIKEIHNMAKRWASWSVWSWPACLASVHRPGRQAIAVLDFGILFENISFGLGVL